MTAQLLETDSFTQTLVQAAPLFKGRALMTYGHNRASHSNVVVYGNDAVGAAGFADELLDQYSSTYGIARWAGFEQSTASGIPNVYGTRRVVDLPIQNTLTLQAFDCGEISLHGSSLASTALEALLLLSGVTLGSHAGYFSTAASGNHSVTGVGFTPELVVFMCFGRNVFTSNSGVFSRKQWSYGATDGSNQWACGIETDGFYGGGHRASRFTQSGVVCSPGLPTISLVSMDPDGFTVNYPSANDSIVIYLALADPGGQFKVGVATQGDTSFAPGFPAEGVLFANSGTTGFDADAVGCVIGLGGADDQLNQYGGFAGGTQNGGLFVNMANLWDTKAVAMSLHKPGPAPGNHLTLDGQAEVTAINPTTVDLNWLTDDGSGMKLGWVAIRTSPGPRYDGCGGTPPQIYRWVTY